MTATATRQIGARTITIRRVRGRAYFRAVGLFLHTFGRALGGLLSGAGIVTESGTLTWASLWRMVSPPRGEDGRPLELPPDVLADQRDAVARLVGSLLSRFDDVDPERLEALAQVLIEGNVDVDGALISKVEALDALLDEPSGYLQIVVAAIRHNVFPTLPDAPTAAGSSGAVTARPRAATPSPRVRRSG